MAEKKKAKPKPKKKPAKKKETRKKKVEFDDEKYKLIARLAEIDCTDYEIAAVLGVSPMTYRNYKKIYPKIQETVDRARGVGNASLLKTQMNVAKERVHSTCRDCGEWQIKDMAFADAFVKVCPDCGSTDIEHKYMPPNTTMLVWLGKQRLGQSDKNDLKLSGDADAPVVINTLADFVKNAAAAENDTKKKGPSA